MELGGSSEMGGNNIRRCGTKRFHIAVLCNASIFPFETLTYCLYILPLGSIDWIIFDLAQVSLHN